MVLAELFCGCGGFSLGAHQAGFVVAAAFDIDATLTSSFASNFPGSRLVLTDVAKLSGETIRASVNCPIDGIFGGPPCQGFSSIGRRQSNDPRRELVSHFYRVINEVRPRFFVMENVRGLGFADARGVLDDALKVVSGHYEIFGPHILDAADFGAATKRRRLFVVGVHKDCGDGLKLEDLAEFRRPAATVREALADLDQSEFIEVQDDFDVWRITKLGRPHEYARALRSHDRTFTGHRPTVHTSAVARRFTAVEPGKTESIGRHPRLHWNGQCPTLRAGTGADKGSYQSVRPLHPEEPRVITVREAARLQGFPDCHRFHPTVWHSFRMIGNSVSPIIAKAIFAAIAERVQAKVPAKVA